jgi:hypothetical protein
LHEVICGGAGKYLTPARLPLPDPVVFRISVPAGQPALAELQIKLRPILSRSPGLWELVHPASRHRFLQPERRSPIQQCNMHTIIAAMHNAGFGILFLRPFQIGLPPEWIAIILRSTGIGPVGASQCK